MSSAATTVAQSAQQSCTGNRRPPASSRKARRQPPVPPPGPQPTTPITNWSRPAIRGAGWGPCWWRWASPPSPGRSRPTRVGNGGVVAQWFTAQSVVERPRGDPQADGHLRGARLCPRLHSGTHEALGIAAAALRVLDVLLDFPLHPAAGADAPLVQPGLPLREDQPGIPFTDVRFFEVQTTTLISQFAAAVLGLTLNQAAYSAEIIRGGILSVDQGQLEAAAALGIPAWRRSTRIVLPQAMRAILPTAFNEIIGLVKGTSIVYVLAYSELFYTVQVIYNRTQQVLPLLLVATLWYVAITSGAECLPVLHRAALLQGRRPQPAAHAACRRPRNSLHPRTREP